MLNLDRKRVRAYLEEFNLRPLFIDELGWDRGGENIEVSIAGRAYSLNAIAHKRGMVAYQHVASSLKDFPDYPTRQKIEKAVAGSVREHIIIYTLPDAAAQYWQWVKREPGRPDRSRQHTYHRGQSGEALIQRLELLAFTLEEEEDLSIVDVSGRVRAAFDVEKVTKRFFERFKAEHKAFLGFIEGIKGIADREWYASLMLNRMMFIYFIQKRGFLDGDTDYLRNRLQRMRMQHGKDKFQRFYRLFLLRLFHEGLGQPEAERAAELSKLLGHVPYLNGGLFDVHDLERENPEIQIPDEAFEKIFSFFDAYQWHLDDRPLHDDKEINPDVLGYIFEKYVNQKQMGAYYTKEDITDYISRNTIIPFLFEAAKRECPIAFKPGGGVWRLLQDDPDRYFFDDVRHGITYDIDTKQDLHEKRDLPAGIADGIKHVSKREGWNGPASSGYALPTETWREHIARRQRYEDVKAKLLAGDVTSIADLVTYNLDIEKFTQDVIAQSEGPELVRAFWNAVNKISVLDPTCGSGAFLFAALNVLEPIYMACLQAMGGFLDDLERSGRKHHSETMSDFRSALDRVGAHASERYFILKQIIIGNLYGVDIMEEAVEICKLRLFLKLVSQLSSYDQIEPLPDIDFNIRPGNTLVGFASLAQVKRALGSDMLKQLALPKIEERAKITDKAFRQFREMQTDKRMSADEFSKAKIELRSRLDELRTQLDEYLAGEYGVKSSSPNAFEKWRLTHQPFHWFVEFYGIVHDGGFDVIIGNPPYLETREVEYSPLHFRSGESGAIHAMCVERSIELNARDGSTSMIVPLALVSTQRMQVVQSILEESRSCWYSNYSWRPGKLFDTVNRALTIFVSSSSTGSMATWTTPYLKWNSDSRKHLIPTVHYQASPRDRSYFWVPKIGSGDELDVLRKVLSTKETIAACMSRSDHRVYYRTTGGLYWKVFTDFAPAFSVNGKASNSSRETNFSLTSKAHVSAAVAILSSDLFWWWYTIASNLRDLNPADWKGFPVPKSAMNDAAIQGLGTDYVRDLKKNSSMLVRVQKSTGRTETQSFKIQKSKPIINQIDKALGDHYGLDESEIDFISNYDIKYRLGREVDDEEE
jgi:hypothetical protein